MLSVFFLFFFPEQLGEGGRGHTAETCSDLRALCKTQNAANATERLGHNHPPFNFSPNLKLHYIVITLILTKDLLLLG